MTKGFLLRLATGVVGVFALVLPLHAATIDTADCAAIDTGDGDTADWAAIDLLVDNDTDVDGTRYYYNPSSQEWSTTKTDDATLSMNPEQQANIKKMKMCNTAEDVYLLIQMQEPMQSYKDIDSGRYVDMWWPVDEDQFITTPADFPYYMVWKFQSADGSGSIVYFAANLNYDGGVSVNDIGSDNADYPQLAIYEEADTDASFADASFSPADDTKLTSVDISDTSDQEGDQDCGDEGFCEPEEVGKASADNAAFEVTQRITELFDNADFAFGDTINVEASMVEFDDDDLSSASTSNASVTVASTTDTAEFTFSQRGVTRLRKVSNSLSDDAVRLKWKKFKTPASARKASLRYQVTVYDRSTGEIAAEVKTIKGLGKTVHDLESDTDYRAIVRAGWKKTNGSRMVSAWSSSYTFATE